MPITNRRLVDFENKDFYPTPAWATQALLDNEEFKGSIWEPACGNGAIAEVIMERLQRFILATDLYDRNYGRAGVDFLTADKFFANIITNPPFALAEEFVQAGLRQATHKLALLLRLSFLEGAQRQRTLFTKTPLARVWVFSERITFYPDKAERQGSGTIAYAWFVWDKHKRETATELKWLPLGYKQKG